LPPGYELSSFNPKYPDAAVGPFIKAMLQGMAAGLGVAYHNLAGDMEGVNYSSARIAELDERDAWMGCRPSVEHMCQPIYDDWLRMSIVAGALPFDLARLDKYRAVKWQPKRWAWVDPQKEVQAQLDAIEGRLRSRTGVIGEMGDDIEDVFEEIQQEEAMAKKMNIAFPAVKPAVNTAAAPGDGTTSADGAGTADTADAAKTIASALVKGVADGLAAQAPAEFKLVLEKGAISTEVNLGDTHLTVEGRGAVKKEITKRDKDGLVETMVETPIERAA
jgi:capsid protein